MMQDDDFSVTTTKAPSVPLAETGPALLSQPQRLEAGAGWRWIQQAWTLFRAEPWTWIGMSLVWLVVVMVLGLLPGVNLLVNLVMFVPMAGFVVAAYELDEHQNLRFEQLFTGFQRHFGQLVLLSLLYMLAIFIIVAPLIVLGVVLGTASGGGEVAGLLIALLGLLALALIIPAVMAVWFAPALIVLNGYSAFEAMKLSFRACLANIVPFLIYGLAMMGLGLASAFTLFLGLIVLYPVMFISYYTSYREVLTEG